MKKFLFVSAAALLVFTVAAEAKHHKRKPTRAEQAYDHGFSDGERYAEGGFTYAECKPFVEVTGEAELWTRWARGRAWKTWRQAVRRQYGEKFMTHAIRKSEDCGATSVNGWYPRCTVSAVPCASRMRGDQ